MEKNMEFASGLRIDDRDLLCKVPEITIFFWIIKILCTTVGETASDFLNFNLNMGLTYTSYLMGGILAVALLIQFKTKKYNPGIYWLCVVLISIVGTLITDNLTDNFGIPLEISTIAFTIALGIVFLIWYKVEGTLSFHSICTRRREAFYWLAILCTFALGTAAGDLVAETLKLGYLTAAIMFGLMIALIVILGLDLKLNPVLVFWIVYILTRPLGASIGDFLSQPVHAGGLGLGTVITSGIFLIAILASVIYLAISKKDVMRNCQV